MIGQIFRTVHVKEMEMGSGCLRMVIALCNAGKMKLCGVLVVEFEFAFCWKNDSS